MDLTRSLVETKAEEYAETQPLAAVEEQHVEILPGMLTGGEFGWRDVEWVVQWYFRRYLGAYPDRERRGTEDAFGENTYEDVMAVLAGVSAASSVEEKLRELRTLDGVEVPVGSAFLQFMFPEEYVVVGDREWRTLEAADELTRSYPESPSVEDYRVYHDVCRGLIDEFGVDAYTLYRALWQLASERDDT
jgi:hypothetical protein